MGYRLLTAGERAIATSVFGPSIHVESIRIYDEGAHFQEPGTIGAPDGNIYFARTTDGLVHGAYRGDFSAADLNLRALFVHELTHVWEKQHGVDVIAQGAGEKASTFFGRDPYNIRLIDENSQWSDLSLEQRAEVI